MAPLRPARLALVALALPLALAAAECADDHSACVDWANQGECRHNPEYMAPYCALSCGLCPGKRGAQQVHMIHGALSKGAASAWKRGQMSAHESSRGIHPVHNSMRRKRVHMELHRQGLLAREEEEEEERTLKPKPRGPPPHAPQARGSSGDVHISGPKQRYVAETGGGGGAWEVVGEEEWEEGFLDWVEPRHIVYLFEVSNMLQVAAHLALLISARERPASLESLSAKMLQLQLAAVVSRSAFCAVSHFGAHWVVRVELTVQALLLVLLLRAHRRRPAVLARLPSEAARSAAKARTVAAAAAVVGAGSGGVGGGSAASCRTPATPTADKVETGASCSPARGQPSSAVADRNFSVAAVCAAAVALAVVLSFVTKYGILTYSTLAFSIFVEAAALVPQRRLLVATARVPVVTGVAVLLLALSRFVRLVMWAVLYHEGDMQHALMAADGVHCVMLARFVHAYVSLLLPRVVVPT